jgi:undecaprenyl-diphosphatase
MLEFLQDLDVRLFWWLNRVHTHWLDEGIYWLSKDLFWIPVAIVLLYIWFRYLSLPQALLTVLALAMLIALTDQLSATVIKPAVRRYRPSHDPALKDKVHLVRGYRGGEYGFVSSHAANTFGVALFCFLLFGPADRRWAWLFLWATVISYTRIYLGVHYPFDILGGALLGMGCACLIAWPFRWLLNRLNKS